MKRRILSLLLAIMLIASLPVYALAAGDDAEDFAGSRRVQFSADWSDLENFVNGGRPAFDLILRSTLPEWASYKLRTQGRDVYFTLEFSFESLADYEEKVSTLVLRKPSLVCSQEDGLLLIENCTSISLLNFLEAALNARNGLSEKTLSDFLTIHESSITVNSETYTLADSVCIHPEGTEQVLVDYLGLETSVNKDNSYTRTITAQIDREKGSSDDVEALEAQFTRVGESKSSKEADNLRQVTVTFEAFSQAELERKTMQCLNVSAFIEEQQTASGRTVQAERTEFVDLDQLLREEGQFYYHYEFPDYWENPTPADESVTVSETSVTSNSGPFVSCSYERELQFSTIEIQTDMSKILGKTRRTILCTLPTDLAAEFHKTIKDKLQLNLTNGAVLEIYDEAGMRCYKISFASWSRRDIEEFTAAILDSSGYTLEVDTTWIPFGHCEIRDSFPTDDMLSRTVPADAITAVYQLQPLTFPDKALNEMDHVTLSGQTVSFAVRSGSSISLPYRQVPVVKTVIELIALVIVLLLIASLVRKIRRFIAKLQGKEIDDTPRREKKDRKQKTLQQSPPEPTCIFCPNCGTENTLAARFCKICGEPLEDLSDLL